MHGGKGEILDELNLAIYNQATYLLNPSKRKDCKGEVLAQIYQKVRM